MMSRACRPMLQPFLSCRSSTATRRGVSMVMGSASDGADGLGQTPGDLPPSSTPAPAPATDSSSTGVVKAPRPPKEKKAPKQAPPPRIIQVAKPKKERVKDKEDEGKWELVRNNLSPLFAACGVCVGDNLQQGSRPYSKIGACTTTTGTGFCWCYVVCCTSLDLWLLCSHHSTQRILISALL